MKRLNTLRAEAPSLLSGFYEPRLKSFSIKPEPEMQENFNGNRPTAQVLKFVFSMRRTISDLMLNAVLEEFKGTDYSGKRKKVVGIVCWIRSWAILVKKDAVPLKIFWSIGS